jgi:hypothetical protein
MITRYSVAVVCTLLTLTSCAPRERPVAEAGEPAADTESIGVAIMTDDGTIILRLRAVAPGGARGEAKLTYRTDHPNYAEIKAHLGPIEPGQTVSVKPWPE